MSLMNAPQMLILRRATYTSPEQAERFRAQGQPERVVAWASGQPIEFVELYDPADGTMLTATVAEGVNGEAPQGQSVFPVLDVKVEAEARTSRSGRDYVATKTKFRLVGINQPASK